jgi:hypothetical protein
VEKVRLTALAVGLLCLSASCVEAPAAQAVTESKPKPAPSTASATINFDTVRIDKQDGMVFIPVLGVSNKTPITVNWGDDSGNETSRVKCAPSTAAKSPARCSLLLQHEYDETGTFTVVVNAGAKTIATKPVIIVPEPRPWSPPEGWVQPSNWSLLGGRASFIPCSTAAWSIDHTGEPADRSTMHDDIAAALAALSAETGLTFVEATDPAQATLSFSYADWGINGVAGRGGPTGINSGRVILNSADEWTKNDWAGLAMVTKTWDADGMHWTSWRPGRGWLIVHETMHALGLGHVEDTTQVMNPIAHSVAFGGGDLDGLHTMYLSQPCPVL